MNELLRTSRENQRGPGGPGSFFSDEDEDAPQIVTVTCGPYEEFLPVQQISVGEIRRRFRDRLDLDPRSIAVLEGRIVGDDIIVTAGQALNFTNHIGEKG